MKQLFFNNLRVAKLASNLEFFGFLLKLYLWIVFKALLLFLSCYQRFWMSSEENIQLSKILLQVVNRFPSSFCLGQGEYRVHVLFHEIFHLAKEIIFIFRRKCLELLNELIGFELCLHNCSSEEWRKPCENSYLE